ncbi:hypothetical protein MMC17_000663 [Xylographa soralifera]|nr:hypothetical protein [Xylographa soralifera]
MPYAASDVRLDATNWSDIPTAILRAELQRRQDTPEKPACGTKGHRGNYNTPLHVFALVLILVLSTLACSFPIIARRFPKLPIPHRFLFLSRHFGTGVLIATAFVHLLPTAFVSLTDPCLPSFWNEGYPAMAGLIAMAACLAVVGIEMFFATRGAGHMHGSEYDRVPEDNGHGGQAPAMNGHVGAKGHKRRSQSIRRFSQGPIGDGGEANGLALGMMGGSSEQEVWGQVPSSPKRSPRLNGTAAARHDALEDSDSQANDSDLDLDELDPTTSSSAADLLPTHAHPPSSYHDDPSSHHHHHPPALTPSHPAADPSLSPHQLQQKLLLQCLLLEAGILFHSIFIGLALSVSTGPPFLVLLIAIAFHQTFEGLALGARIAALPALPPTSSKPWLMALAYGATTPLGQAVGLAVHGLYDPAGEVGLLMVGVMNAVSSGLLLFAGLVELLAEDFLSESSYRGLRGWRRGEAWGAVVGGAVVMAVVGGWA